MKTKDLGRSQRRFRLSRLAMALASGALLATASVHASPITDVGNEPTNDVLTGAELGAVGDTFTGCVGSFCPGDTAPEHQVPIPGDGFFSFDPADFLSYASLNPGLTYTLSIACDFCEVFPVEFDLYENGTLLSLALPLQSPAPAGTSASINLSSLTSLAIGVVAFRSSENTISTNACCEGYTVQLQVGRSVPEPATLALLAAGLAGALLTRRRRRP